MPVDISPAYEDSLPVETGSGYGTGTPLNDDAQEIEWGGGAYIDASGGGGGNSCSGLYTGTAGGIVTVKERSASTLPVVDFTAIIQADLIVTFSNTSVGGSLYRWDFGDGSISTLKNPVHQFAYPGIYNIKLAVQSPLGALASTTQEITVTQFSRAVDFEYATFGLTAYFTARENFTGAGYLWDFGDGVTSTAKNPSHIYAANGNYNVTLTVSGLTKSYAVTISLDVLLEWDDNSSDETGFKIEHSTDNVTFSQIATVGAGVTQFGISNGQYGINTQAPGWFKVRAYNANGNSTYTNTARIN